MGLGFAGALSRSPEIPNLSEPEIPLLLPFFCPEPHPAPKASRDFVMEGNPHTIRRVRDWDTEFRV